MIDGIAGVPSARKSDSEAEWLKSRHGTISASITADCYPAENGKKIGYSYPTECWAKLVAGIDPERFKSAGQGVLAANLLRTGEMLQPAIEQMWLDRHPDAVRVDEACERSFKHPQYEYLTATPDLVVRQPDGQLLIVEIKATQNLKYWKHYGEFSVPRRVRIQVQQQMGILGIDRAVVCLYPITGDANGEPIWESDEIRFAADEWAENLHWSKAMYECVRDNKAPVFHEAYSGFADYEIGIPSALSKIHSTDSLEVDTDTARLVDELRMAKSQLKKLIQQEKQLAAMVKGKFGLASELTYEGKVIATYKGGFETDQPTIIAAAEKLEMDVVGLNAEEIVAAFPSMVAEDYASSSRRRLMIKEHE